MNTEELILKFWNSWQQPADWNEMRSCLADDYQFDAGMFKCSNGDEAVAIAQMGNPWKEVELLDMICKEDHAAIIYQGIDINSGAQFRVSEFLKIKDRKITGGFGVVTQLPA